MDCKIFISHSSQDKEIAGLLVNFLTNGLGVSDDEIFCSSVAGSDIPIGINFNEYIKGRIQESADFYTIAIISNSYYNSKYCLYELGAAWGLSKTENIIPFLIGGMNHGDPKDFIKFNQSVVGEKVADVNKLADRIRNDSVIRKKVVAIENFEIHRLKLVEGTQAYNSDLRKVSNSKTSKSQNQKFKVVAFDFDGTILQGRNYRHSWMSIWRYLNYDDSIRKSLLAKHLHDHKSYNFQDWCEECAEYFKKRNFKKSDVNEIIKSNGLKIATNFNEVVSVLHALGIKVIIISGGIDTFIEETIDDNTLELIDEIYVNKFTFKHDGSLDKVQAYQNTDSDGVGKIRALDIYCEKNNVKREDVVYVGDQINDMDILQVVGKAIVYPADKSSVYLREKQLNFDLVHEDSLVHILPKILS